MAAFRVRETLRKLRPSAKESSKLPLAFSALALCEARGDDERSRCTGLGAGGGATFPGNRCGAFLGTALAALAAACAATISA